MRDSFVFYRSFINAIEELPPEEFKKIILATANYALNDIQPDIDGVNKMAFNFMQPVIDSNNKKWDETRKKRAESGRKGGQAKQANARNAKQNLANQAVNVNGNVDVNVNGGGNVEKTTTTFFNFCKNLGYPVDQRKAEELETGLDPSWLTGEFHFPEYVAGLVKESYSDKPETEQRRLFIHLLSAEDRRADFPAWREKKITETAKEEKRQQEKKAKNNKPTRCICGKTDLWEQDDEILCRECRNKCRFNNGVMRWEWESLGATA